MWLRYFSVYRKSFFYSLTTTWVEPLLYLGSFGIGLGRMVGPLTIGGHEFTYRQFIFSGILGQTLLFQAFFEAAYGSFIRMYYQRIFQAMAVTPITLREILWAELLWDASKATLASVVVLLLGSLVGDFNPVGALLAVPFCFLAAFLFAGLGLTVSAYARTIEEISFPQYLFIFPMFLFCGVFYPIENLPSWVQGVVMALPLTAVIQILRAFVLGTALSPWSIGIALSWLVVLTSLSQKAMHRRLVR